MARSLCDRLGVRDMSADQLPALAAGSPVPLEQNPEAVYLMSLADGPGRALMGSSAEVVKVPVRDTAGREFERGPPRGSRKR